MKRGLLGFPLLIFLIQFVSAQFFGGYGGFSLTNFFSSIDPTTITFGLLFLIFFILIFYALSRVFKDSYGQPNKGVAGGLAFAVTSLIIYGLYRTGFNFENIFYDLGLSAGSLYPILTILFLVVAIILIRKLRFSGFLMIFGLFILLLAIFTDIFYEKLVAFVIGAVFFLIGLALWRRRKKKRGRGESGYGYDYSPRKPGMFSRYREKRRDFGDMKHEQKLGYKRQRVEEEYQRRLHEGEVRRRAKKIKKIRGRRGRKEKPERKRQEEFKKAQKAAYNEDARRDREIQRQQAEEGRREQAQQQIQQINNEIARLEQEIPSASVIERGQKERQIKILLKKAKKLR